MSKLKIIDKMIKAILSNECKHKHINEFNSGSYCPDCGQAVKVSWITVKCQRCNWLRMPKNTGFNEVVPLDRFCTHCGYERWYSNKSDKILFSESMYAIPVKEIIEGESGSDKSTTDVWVEQSDNSGTRRYSNVIKASKRFK